jgi:hypothetical protein
MSVQIAMSSKRIQNLRNLIAAAERDGCKPDAMLLHLTLGDASELKRDRSVAVHEISFSEEGMKFLGVKVVQGGVTVSSLDRAPA